MFYFIIGAHLLLCLMLIGLVLLQQGKGADMGAAFGAGASSSLFGAGGATSLIIKVTTGVAIAFMVTSILLIKNYGGIGSGKVVVSDPLSGSVMKDLPAAGVEPREKTPEDAAGENLPLPAAEAGGSGAPNSENEPVGSQ